MKNNNNNNDQYEILIKFLGFYRLYKLTENVIEVINFLNGFL